LWGADVLVRGAPVEITVPRTARVRSAGGLAVIRSPLPAGDVASWAGIPVTTPGRTAFDLARRLPLAEAVVAVDAMLAARLLTPADLAVSSARRPRWPGLGRLRKVLLLCDAGAESPQESRLRLILIAGGLSHSTGSASSTRATITAAAACSSMTCAGSTPCGRAGGRFSGPALGTFTAIGPGS
jgi:hypothetical protein